MKEFKPAFWFLAIFLGLYLGLNIIYGVWVSSFGKQADSATLLITKQTSYILNLFGEENSHAAKRRLTNSGNSKRYPRGIKCFLKVVTVST
jgi:hypothetical protein